MAKIRIKGDTSGYVDIQAPAVAGATTISTSNIVTQDSDGGAITLPAGTTAQRPASPSNGMIRYNTDDNELEVYREATWENFSMLYNIEYLVVAGGGGGGAGRASESWFAGGGGGAGGAIDSTLTVPVASVYSIVVGAGGNGQVAGANHQTATGVDGNNSTAFGQTAIGGGAAGSYQESGGIRLGRNGGSGGGGGAGGTDSTGGSGTAGQGNDGGTGAGSGGTGGGGGASASGENGSGEDGGNGGDGINWKSLGTYYAGGGGGGAPSISGYNGTPGDGGQGGGGDGRVSVGSGAVGNAGTANTGGGGGGMGGDAAIVNTGGAGGSGIVIIRYLGGQRATGGTVTSAGGYTYHTFTSSGTFTA
jgi:hypothetical protein